VRVSYVAYVPQHFFESTASWPYYPISSLPLSSGTMKAAQRADEKPIRRGLANP
jgi:hypothetical protein